MILSLLVVGFVLGSDIPTGEPPESTFSVRLLGEAQKQSSKYNEGPLKHTFITEVKQLQVPYIVRSKGYVDTLGSYLNTLMIINRG